MENTLSTAERHKTKKMGRTYAYFNGAHVIGNFNKLLRKKPKGWIENGYKIIVPFDFKWRERIGKVECDCKEVEEHFMPWYGTSWYHSPECAILKHLEAHPGIANLVQYYDYDFRLIATTE